MLVSIVLDYKRQVRHVLHSVYHLRVHQKHLMEIVQHLRLVLKYKIHVLDGNIDMLFSEPAPPSFAREKLTDLEPFNMTCLQPA